MVRLHGQDEVVAYLQSPRAYWIKKLREMEKKHCVELDHKDCGEIADLLE